MPRRRYSPNDNNLTLPLTAAESSESVQFRGVFSATYINNRLRRSPDLASDVDVRPVYDQVRQLWIDNHRGLVRRPEAHTRTAFLDPVLRLLGWSFIPEAQMPAELGTRLRKRPDYCLFTSEEDGRRAAESDLVVDLFRLSASVLEAKKAGHNLDDASREETPGWFPSQQIQDYLSSARDATGTRFFNWAILTNGNEWRLYTERAARDACFSIHLAHGETFCNFRDFQLFYTLFRAAAFQRDTDGRIFLDDLHSESLSAQAGLEENLQKRVFVVLEDLATGFLIESRNPHSFLSEAIFS